MQGTSQIHNSIDQNLGNILLSKNYANLLTRKTSSVEKSKICDQCDYASSRKGNLRQHLTTHSGEK